MESGADAVGGASDRGAGEVGVEVLVHVEYEIVSAAVEVSDAGEDGSGATRDECAGASVTVAWNRV